MPKLDLGLLRCPAPARLVAAAVVIAAISSFGVGTAGATGDTKDKDKTPSPKEGSGAKTSTSAKSGGGNAPAGNNGTIKIDEYTMLGGNRNRSHLTCGLSVSFFGYDGGTQHATITLTPHSPTKGGTPLTVATDWTIARRTSGNQFDKNVPIAPAAIADVFAGVAPAKQGFHVRIDVHVTGSQGSDAKHKVVWVKPCSTEPTTTSSTAVGFSAAGSEAGSSNGSGAAGTSSDSGVAGRSAAGGAGAGGIAPGTAAEALNLASTTTG